MKNEKQKLENAETVRASVGYAIRVGRAKVRHSDAELFCGQFTLCGDRYDRVTSTPRKPLSSITLATVAAIRGNATPQQKRSLAIYSMILDAIRNS